VGKKEKLIKRLKSNPKDFTFDEMGDALESLGFKVSKTGKTSGSRAKFMKGNVPIILHKPHPRKELPEYQIKQVLEILEKEGSI
jgi:predicted RNA binding protein YcfA (HicA-like mRNA interferase family)